MKYIQFKIKSRDLDYFFNVFVYDNIKDMRNAAVRFNSKIGKKESEDKTMGITHMYERIRFDKKGREILGKNCGIIRLAKRYTSTSVVAHELIHAGLWIYRLAFGTENIYEGSCRNADFGSGCKEEEETFAHIYDQLFRNTTRKLYKLGIWL